MGEGKTTGFPIDFSETLCEIRSPALHYERIQKIPLEMTGYTWEEITQLKDVGAI